MHNRRRRPTRNHAFVHFSDAEVSEAIAFAASSYKMILDAPMLAALANEVGERYERTFVYPLNVEDAARENFLPRRCVEDRHVLEVHVQTVMKMFDALRARKRAGLPRPGKIAPPVAPTMKPWHFGEDQTGQRKLF